MIESANLQNRYEPPFRPANIQQVIKELMHPLPLCADLPFQHDIALFVTKIHGQLLAVLVDCKVSIFLVSLIEHQPKLSSAILDQPTLEFHIPQNISAN